VKVSIRTGTTDWHYSRDFFGAEVLIRHRLGGSCAEVDPRRFPRTMTKLLAKAEQDTRQLLADARRE